METSYFNAFDTSLELEDLLGCFVKVPPRHLVEQEPAPEHVVVVEGGVVGGTVSTGDVQMLAHGGPRTGLELLNFVENIDL